MEIELGINYKKDNNNTAFVSDKKLPIGKQIEEYY